MHIPLGKMPISGLPTFPQTFVFYLFPDFLSSLVQEKGEEKSQILPLAPLLDRVEVPFLRPR